MGIKDKLLAKTAGIREEVDAEIARMAGNDKPAHPRTAIGHAGAFQVEISKSQERIRALEAKIADLEKTTVPIENIAPNPWQPRRVFNQTELAKLAESIAEVGLIQPVILRRVPTRDTFQLVAGERRWRAHKLLAETSIRAIIIEASDEEMIALALAENFDRADLTAYEVALAIRVAAQNESKRNLAKALGISRSDLYRYLSFFELPDFIVSDLEVNPGLLGRDASEAIVSMIKKYGLPCMDTVSRIWTRIKAGEIDQGSAASLIEAAMTKRSIPMVKRDIRKLFAGKEHAGSITRDASKLKIEIKVVALTQEKEEKLRRFVEDVLREEEQ